LKNVNVPKHFFLTPVVFLSRESRQCAQTTDGIKAC